ncbi:MAG TPA: hypothetical protein PKD53_21035 [Chloroflexaceae bacterium]|nr:hypothetical protein [Chloroflexaceae bacterium]
MAFPKNSKSALMALAAAGGLWAWQNRTKLAGMVQQMQTPRRSQHELTGSPMASGPYTDATRRLEGEPPERGSGEGI